MNDARDLVVESLVAAGTSDLVRDEENYRRFLRVVAGRKKNVMHYIPLGATVIAQ